MTSIKVSRPKELKLAVSLASLGLVIDMASVIAWRDFIGEGWVLVLTAKFIVAAFYMVLFSFALMGRAWVRFVYLVFFVYGLFRVSSAGVEFFVNPFVLVSIALSTIAIAFWFMPATNRWYRAVKLKAA